MGRATYEIGYTYGMKPGDLPYGDRSHHIFSENIDLPEKRNLNVVRGDTLANIDRIKTEAAGPVYLCGGGRFAGHLVAHERIDSLRIKLNPHVYGTGIRLFENLYGLKAFTLTHVERYSTGVVLLDYNRL